MTDTEATDSDQTLGERWQAQWQQTPKLRRRYGVFYTPQRIADRFTAMACGLFDSPPKSVLEPTCGAGVFLQSVANYATQHWGWDSHDCASHLVGNELDPVAAGIARSKVGAHVEQLDYLVGEWPADLPDSYDLIIGNPPFGGAIRGDTGRSQRESEYFRERFPLSARGAYDRCALFIERSMELLSRRGVLAFIVPRQVLAAPSAAGLREMLSSRGPVSVARIDDPHLFSGADVHVCGIIIGPLSRGSSDEATVYHLHDGQVSTRLEPFSGQMASWSPLLDGTASLVAAAEHFPALGSFLRVSASATTAEAYEWKKGVFDEPDRARDDEPQRLETSKRLVISGSIEPFDNLWGRRTTRYLGDRYERPMILDDALSERRLSQALDRKVLLPGLSRVLEATIDISGEYVGAVATMTIRFLEDREIGEDIHFLRLAAVLNSSWCRLQYRALHAASALSGGNIGVSRSKLERLTVLPEWRDWLEEAPAQRSASTEDHVHSVLSEVHMELEDAEISGLYKRVPTMSDFFELIGRAIVFGGTRSREILSLALDHCLRVDPRGHLRSGTLDFLLASIATNSLELIASEAVAVE